jgi:dienelactone hydrolase
LVLAVALALATGCAGNGDGGSPPTATATSAPTATGTAAPSATASRTASATAPPTATSTATGTPPPTATAPPSATHTPTVTDTATPSATPSETPDASRLAKYAGRGPYPVGVTTLNIGDRDIEVWYPLDPGSEAGAEKASYASFTVLPEAIQQLLPPDLNIVVPMDAYRDLPASGAGPFPILTFSHGAGGFRQAYSGFLTGIASHGFVVASLDHLEWGLLAQVGLRPPGADRTAGEVALAAVSRLAAASADPGSPLAGGVDAMRVITAGHSAGGRAAFALPDHAAVKAMIGYATGNSSSGVSGAPVLLLAGAEDAGAPALEAAYDDLSAVKRFVAIDRGGHNSFTDQCAIIHGGNNFLERLVEAGFPIPPALLEQAIDGCRPENLAPAEFWSVAQHFTVAHARAALGLDEPPVGLGAGVADAFAGVTLRYRFDDDPSQPPEDVHGFVVSRFASVVPTFAAGSCPRGFNLSNVEREARHLPLIADDCAHPEAGVDDDFQTFAAPATVDGWNLDGADSRATDAGPCAHDDLAGPLGESGFDLQLWRAVGCVRGFQPGEIADVVVDQAVRDGSMTILVEVRGLDDWQQDDSVRVQVFGSLDAPPIGATGTVLPFGTLSVHPSARYRSQVGAAVVRDGVLTAGPMDVRVPINIQIVGGDLTFHDAWVRLARQSDGTVRGQLFGFQPLEEFYDIFGRKAGQAGASALGYTCTGLHAALASQADGDYDPDTGRCTSLSTGYQFTAVPAFIAR